MTANTAVHPCTLASNVLTVVEATPAQSKPAPTVLRQKIAFLEQALFPMEVRA